MYEFGGCILAALTRTSNGRKVCRGLIAEKNILKIFINLVPCYYYPVNSKYCLAVQSLGEGTEICHNIRIY